MEGVVGPLDQIGVDLRGVEVPQDAVVHELALLIDHLDLEVLPVVDDHKVRQIPGAMAPRLFSRKYRAAVYPAAFTAMMGSAPRRWPLTM